MVAIRAILLAPSFRQHQPAVPVGEAVVTNLDADATLSGGPDQGPFDRERTLGELLSPVLRVNLERSLRELLGQPLRLSDSQGRFVLGADVGPPSERGIVMLECEPVGVVEAPAGTAKSKVGAAAMLVELLVISAHRYQMAAHLHMEAVKEDFHRLMEKHDALEASEARYKLLAEQLEQRVADQVKTIDTARRQLYQAEKLASVGQLAAGVAHEINNPIGFIASNLNTAESYVRRLQQFAEGIRCYKQDPDFEAHWKAADLDFLFEDFSELLRESAAGALRVARIVADLKGFSRVDAPAVESADVNEIIRGVCTMAAAQLQSKATLELELNPLPRLTCHAGQLGQVFLNIVLNAVQALEGFGQIRISTATHSTSIQICIQDTGPGIPADILPRLFEPFFTTKDVGQGTGLGLTVSHDIVKAHGGQIAVDTTLGKGTTFIITLPLQLE